MIKLVMKKLFKILLFSAFAIFIQCKNDSYNYTKKQEKESYFYAFKLIILSRKNGLGCFVVSLFSNKK